MEIKSPLTVASLFSNPQARAGFKARNDQINLLLAGLEKADPERAAALRQKQSEANSLLQQLQSSRKNVSEERRQAAREKIERIKAQIAALRMMAGGDPRTVARQAARLARELASAVREYRGSGIDAGVFAAQGGTVIAPASAEAGATEDASAAAAQGEAQAIAAQAQTQQEANGQPSPEKDPLDEIKAMVADIKEQLAAARENQAFENLVRKLVNDLRNIIKNAKLRLEQQGGGTTLDILQGEDALREVEQTLGETLALPINIHIQA